MPRKNRNVRTRNLPRAAQRQPRTTRAQFDVRADRVSTGQHSVEDRADAEYALYMGDSAK